MSDAFFIRDGARFVATDLTRGPWDPDAQHGGPPAALLGTLLESCARRDDMMVVRVTIEILKPIPVATFTADARVVRDGRSVQLVAGSLSANGEEILRGQAVRIRTKEVGLPDVPSDAPAVAPPGPEHGKPSTYAGPIDVGYHTAMEASFIRGDLLGAAGPAIVWMRMRFPLIEGEPVSPLARVLIAADSGNGVSAPLDHTKWLFINPDLTVYLHREPVGEWICMDARTTISRRGIGLAESALHDQQGPIGRGLQSLFIGPR